MLPFNRRFVLIPLLASIALVIAAFFSVEIGRAGQMNNVNNMRRSYERERILAEVQLLLTGAESGQRGYLLTGDELYLKPYEDAKRKADDYIRALGTAYSAGDLQSVQPLANKVIQLIGAKFNELDSTITLYRDPNRKKGQGNAIALVKTNVGRDAMELLRETVDAMRESERKITAEQLTIWAKTHAVSRTISAAGSLLNLVLLLLAGYLITKDIQRRTQVVTGLEAQVQEHLHALSELSTHLLYVSEAEKSALARELHDELGGLLVGIKMDLAQMRSKVDFTQPDMQRRWDRVQSLLAAGIDLKRRIIEQLRPSLLDNMGLIAAIRWQADEICGAAKLQLEQHYPESEPDITGDAAIAIFRIAQEALTNVVKHARASHVIITMEVSEEQLVLWIEDDGVGLPIERWSATGSHGIAGIRHRLVSFGGMLTIEKAEPTGTRLSVALPTPRISQHSQHAP